jgi:hypothetical protein
LKKNNTDIIYLDTGGVVLNTHRDVAEAFSELFYRVLTPISTTSTTAMWSVT